MRKRIEEQALFFSKTLDFFDLYLPRQAGKSNQTVRSYRYALSLFFDYVVAEKGMSATTFCFSDCTYDLVLEFSQYMREIQKASPATVNARIAAIKAYLKYVADTNISVMQVYIRIERVPALTVPKRIRPIIEKGDLKSFFETPPNTRIGNRDRMILILLYDSAIRVSELTAITLGDVLLDVVCPAIQIEGKGRKQRTIELSDIAVSHLKNYIAEYHGDDFPPERPLFYSVIHGDVNQMSTRNIERIVNKYGKLAREKNSNIPESVYPHMIRRTKATNLHRDNIALNVISSLLGHENEETTRLYANLSPEQLKEATTKGSEQEPQEQPLSKDNISALKKRFGLK